MCCNMCFLHNRRRGGRSLCSGFVYALGQCVCLKTTQTGCCLCSQNSPHAAGTLRQTIMKTERSDLQNLFNQKSPECSPEIFNVQTDKLYCSLCVTLRQELRSISCSSTTTSLLLYVTCSSKSQQNRYCLTSSSEWLYIYKDQWTLSVWTLNVVSLCLIDEHKEDLEMTHSVLFTSNVSVYKTCWRTISHLCHSLSFFFFFFITCLFLSIPAEGLSPWLWPPGECFLPT